MKAGAKPMLFTKHVPWGDGDDKYLWSIGNKQFVAAKEKHPEVVDIGDYWDFR